MYAIALLAVVYSKNKRLAHIALLTLVFFSVFRGENVGVDTGNAMSQAAIYNRTNRDFSIVDSSSYEITTNFVYYIISRGAPNRTIIVFYSLVMFFFLWKSVNKLRLKLSYFVFVFLISGCYIYSYNVARQWASLSIVLYAISFIFEGKWKKSLWYFPLILFAISIHTSSIIYIVLYVFRYFRFSRSYAFCFVVLMALLSLSGIVDIRDNIGQLLQLETFSGYESYYGDNLYDINEASFMGRLFNLMVVVIMFIAMVRMKDLYSVIALFSFAIGISFYTEGLSSIIARSFFGFTLIKNTLFIRYLSVSKDKILIIAYSVLYTYDFFTHGIMDEYYFFF